ncbi:MFS transporter [Paracoccus pacificus]|uniref:MFS transporter n=1 Tax=Paracoccus pacificus TaxID=1463598 RepID=A0ABW4R7K7_9RHOB
MPVALYALTAGAFGIGVTEFVIMGLLLEVSRELNVTIAAAGLLISGYALGVTIGAPVLTALTAGLPRKQVLVGLMVIFVIGNAACALAPNYGWLMAARVLTALTHGTFFGVGAVVATDLVAKDKRASAIAIMFTGLTVATVLGVPFGTWLGQNYGWRASFWAVTLVGLIALVVLAVFVPQDRTRPEAADWRADLRAIARRPVLLGLLTTVLGYAGVFAVFTYIAPLLTKITGFADGAVSPILLVFGGGLVMGNLLGGRLADRNLIRAILGTLTALAIVLAGMGFALNSRVAAVAFTGLLGAAGFATVAPLQMWVLSKAEGAGQSLASSFNIGAFNLGNAIGAWAGGMVITHGPGLALVPITAALFPMLAIATALIAVRTGKSAPLTPSCKPVH